MNARLTLEAAERAFPIAEMGVDFKGHHSLTLHEGLMALTVWVQGQCHTFSLGEQEEQQAGTVEGCDALMEALRGLIAQKSA